jgi:hypothetical protein
LIATAKPNSNSWAKEKVPRHFGRVCLGALRQFHQQARSAVPVQIANLDDPDDRTHSAVTNALMAIAPEVLTNRVKEF